MVSEVGYDDHVSSTDFAVRPWKDFVLQMDSCRQATSPRIGVSSSSYSKLYVENTKPVKPLSEKQKAAFLLRVAGSQTL